MRGKAFSSDSYLYYQHQRALSHKPGPHGEVMIQMEETTHVLRQLKEHRETMKQCWSV